MRGFALVYTLFMAAPSLPKKLLKESAPTKLAYFFLLPYEGEEVELTSRQLVSLLGLSERTAFEALTKLKALGALKTVRESAGSRSARYKVKGLR